MHHQNCANQTKNSFMHEAQKTIIDLWLCGLENQTTNNYLSCETIIALYFSEPFDN